MESSGICSNHEVMIEGSSAAGGTVVRGQGEGKEVIFSDFNVYAL